jgi:thioredoxin reductase (NADPH)
MNEIYDVIIIGAGPAGLSAAIYTGRARLKTLVMEKGMPGGQILRTDFVENYPGFPEGMVPFQLMQNFRKQAEKFGAEIITEEAAHLSKKNDFWLVEGKREEYPAQAVVVCTGSVYRRLGLQGEERLIGKGVSYCATCDGAFFKNRVVGVVGGGDNALREALFLTKFCRSIKLIHRRRQFRGEKIYHERVLSNQKIEVLWDTVVEKISGAGKFESITVRNLKTNKTSQLKLDGLFISIGTVPNSGFVKGLLDLDEWGQIKVGPSMTSSQPGIFAAGDVTDACPEQIATAVGTGVTAALSVSAYLETKIKPS